MDRQTYFSGMKAGLPILFSFIPVGIAFALMARQAGFSAPETIMMSVTVFAGASEMMAVGMYAQGASIIAIIFATFILNLRHLIMSTCVENRMKEEGTGLKLLAAFGVTDESFAIFTTAKPKGRMIVFFLGLITVTYSSWIAGTAIGAFFSDLLPPIISASLGIAMYAMFLGILVPNLNGNLKLLALVAVTAAVNSLLSLFMAGSWSLIVSTLLCAFLGVFFVELPDEVREEFDEN